MRVELSGTEVHTIECTGVLPTEHAARLVPGSLTLREEAGGVQVGLLAFAMSRLGASSPVRIGPRFDYGELLWRLAVTWRDAPAWFAVACDLDHAWVRAMGAWIVRYPVRRAAIEIESARARVRTDAGAIEITARVTEHAPEAIAPAPILVAAGAALYRIPWREDAAPYRREAAIEVSDEGLTAATLGAEVQWAPRGLVHAGRVHHCGIAARVQ